MERNRRKRTVSSRGFTLMEIMIVLGIAGVLLGASIPRVRNVRDRVAVRSASEEVVGLLSRARYHAVLRGGAEVRLSEVPDLLTLGSSSGFVERRDLAARYGVDLDILGSSPEIVLRFDGMGLGRFTSRTLELRRGDARARLMLSSYGRIRRG